MEKTQIIIVNGLPCTGKTTIAREIAEHLGWPFIYKDGIKEILFDTIGWSDRAWSKKMSLAAYELMYHQMEQLLKAKTTFVMESNFRADVHRKRLVDLQKQYNFEPLEILCYANGEKLFKRFKERARNGTRHPGHVDEFTFDELRMELLAGKTTPLKLSEAVLEVDTTVFEMQDGINLLQTIQAILLSKR